MRRDKRVTVCKRSANGLYYVTAGTNGYISAVIEQSVDLGSHMMFIAAVEDMEVLSDVPSATYAYYQSDIKPKPEKVAAGVYGVSESIGGVWCVVREG